MTTRAISHESLTSIDWTAMRSMDPEPASDAMSSLLTHLDGIEEQVFAARGMACLLIEERLLWKFQVDDEIGDYFQSFDHFLKVTCPKSWGYCRDAMRAVKELRDMPFTELLSIKRCNLEQLKKVSSKVRVLPEVIEAAKNLPEKQFVARVNERFPDQHLESKRPVVMAPEGDVDEFEYAIEIAMLVEECETRAEAIKAIAVSYTQDNEAAYLAKKESVGIAEEGAA